MNTSFGKLKDDNFNFDLIDLYFRKKDNSASWHVLSDRTCNDLDFQELFMFLDRTTSKVGQQFLYNRLRDIPENGLSNELNEEIIESLSEDQDLRVRTQLQLEKLSKIDAYFISSLFQEEHLKPPKWFFAIRILAFVSLMCLVILPFYPQLIIVFVGLIVINLGIHYWNKRNLFRYVGSIPQLLQLNSIAKNLHKDYLYNKINPHLTESIQHINKVRNRMLFFELEAKLQGDFQALFWVFLELLKILFLLEPILLFAVLNRLDSRRKEIEDVFFFVGQIDSLISISSLRSGLDTYCLPTIDSDKIKAEQMYHPLIINCVSNSLDVNDKSILITGSNMSGKTSFIRAIGINVITGLTINTCFAKSMTIPRLRVYSAIRISDDLMNDRSYYFEEVQTIKQMIKESSNGDQNLFLLDEIFKGTNTIERIAAGKAVLSLLSQNSNIVFVSTHDIELTDLLNKEYELFHFSETVKETSIDFDYQLKEGKLQNRNAIRILQLNEYPERVVNEAMEISKQLDRMASRNTEDSP